MTLTFNPSSYGELLARYQPKVLTSEQECDEAIALAERLEFQNERTPAEESFLELLTVLITHYEEAHYPIPEGDPLQVLHHLMEAQDLRQEDLVGIVGSRGVVSEVVNGKRSISKAQAKALAEYFGVDVGLFI
ncbi:helix-turn-helix domain-containing protein [Lyngbya confervoides]|uniref:Helix-turn-helix domain-containing protein n=1 Tax=Lyngbya confervoides BDU141951 TaxID=1574623 RepID=A0ABD4T209_9CYAN|nr:helix-turn-helix domain-containing protein [Lyngbya confervoides]MCM1982421.1 helix-turn-helix domain-containing protein [Lyngbya confervoides BDU141951]